MILERRIKYEIFDEGKTDARQPAPLELAWCYAASGEASIASTFPSRSFVIVLKGFPPPFSMVHLAEWVSPIFFM